MNSKTRFGSLSPLRFSRGTALLATLSLTLLAGCGGGGGGNNNVNNGSGSAGVFSNKSFVASSLALGANQSGSLTVAVGTDAATIAGTLNLAVASVAGESKAATRQTSGTTTYSIPLSGTFNASSGAFSLKGLLSRGTATYNVTATGTLSTSGTSGGSTTITINDTSYTGTFASPSSLSGTLSAAYFPLTYNGGQVYQETSTSSDGTTSTQTDTGYSFLGGFGTPLGTTTTTTLNGTTVNQVQELNSEGSGAVEGYYYYTLANSALTVYGFDDVDSTGATSGTSRFSPAYTLPLTLTAGQAYSQTVKVTYNYSGSTSSTPQTDTFTTGLTFNDFESITVPAGTYNAAKVTNTTTINIPASDGFGAGTAVTTSTIYLVQGLGVVQEHDVSVTSYGASGTTPASTQTFTEDYILTSTASDETRSAKPATAVKSHTPMGLFGMLRGSRR